MTVSAETLNAYFSLYGWQAQATDDEDVFVVAFSGGDEQRFGIVIALEQEWVTFSCPLMRLPSSEASSVLLKQNYKWSLLKASLDDEDNIVLSVELPADGFSYDGFAAALDVLSQGCDQISKMFPSASTISEENKGE